MNRNIISHELAYRKEEVIDKIENIKLLICGVGAIGSNLTENLVRQGFDNITVVDYDVVEEHNIGTQSYCVYDLGILKVQALSRKIFRDLKASIQINNNQLTEDNIGVLKEYDLIVDAFDNHKSRFIVTDFCQKNNIPCVHAGMSGDGYFQIVWNDNYIVPKDNEDAIDICEYPLARNLVMLTSSFLSEVIINYIVYNDEINIEFTIGDFKISKI